MNWNQNQQKAIDERGKNILVSAAAGSGKTAVLVERIKKLVIEDGVSIDRMLIVTFTNAAAAEMKEKIRIALNKEIDANPQHSRKLTEQLRLLSRANISTFHAFALEVIRKFFYLIDMEPSFSICDDVQGTMIKENAMDRLLEEKFAEGSEAFYTFLDWYSEDRNQNRIREMIGTSYKVLQALPYPWQWLSEKIGQLHMDKAAFMDADAIQYVWNVVEESIKMAVEYSNKAVRELEEDGLDRLATKVSEGELTGYKALTEAVENRNLEALSVEIENFRSVRLVANKEEKEDYQQIQSLVTDCRKKATAAMTLVKELLFTTTLDEQIEELNKTAPLAETLENLLLDFDQKYKAGKRTKKLIDFNDIEHYCLEILDHSQASDHYKDKFAYVFIDEYQDTNILQEEIISRVKRENNLFMVGDIKQSIYKFRLAEPEIFKHKYEAYGKADSPDCVKIDLNQNYRSKEAVLMEINQIFQPVMEDYDDAAKLHLGAAYDGPHNFVPEVKVLDVSTIDEADEDLTELKNVEIEARLVGSLIKENIGRIYFDGKSGKEKTIRPRDIVILMRSVKSSAEYFYQSLKDQGIESYVDDNEGYFDTMEINIFMNLLSVIDNRLQDVPLISTLHSEIFGFSTAELALIREEYRKGAYGEAFLWYADQGEDMELREKCLSTIHAIKGWKDASATMPLGRFIWRLLLDTGYYLTMGAMPGGTQRQANLRALVDKAEKFSEDRQSSLYSFMKYVDGMKHRKISMGQVKLVGEGDDLVRMMTIHKSKGLEFPMVIVAGMGRKLTYTKMAKGVAIHKDIGIGLTLSDVQGHWWKDTLLQKLIQHQMRREEAAEHVRVLYVALTRAKEILYMTGTIKDGEKYLENRDTGVERDSSYLDMIGAASRLEVVSCGRLERGEDEKIMAWNDHTHTDIFNLKISAEKREEVLKRLSFRYPYEHARKLKSKYSVTEMNRENTESAMRLDTLLAVPKFRQGEKKLNAAEKGTIYHGIMEKIDFDQAEKDGRDYVVSACKEMISAEIFTEEEIGAVDLNRIVEFFETDLGARCAAAFRDGKLQREKPFNLQVSMEGETVIVQGVIDCCFEEGDEMVLLDYKTSRIDHGKDFGEEADRLRGMYQEQMNMYAKALEAAKGKKVREGYLYLFGAGRMIRIGER